MGGHILYRSSGINCFGFAKGYILLGDDELLDRFNRHYSSLAKHNTLTASDGMSKGDGSFLKTVSMHQPGRHSKTFIDSLLAFWPGLQVC